MSRVTTCECWSMVLTFAAWMTLPITCSGRRRESGKTARRFFMFVGNLEWRSAVEPEHFRGCNEQDEPAQVVIVGGEVGRQDIERGGIGSSSVWASMRFRSGRPVIMAQTRFTVARAK